MSLRNFFSRLGRSGSSAQVAAEQATPEKPAVDNVVNVAGKAKTAVSVHASGGVSIQYNINLAMPSSVLPISQPVPPLGHRTASIRSSTPEHVDALMQQAVGLHQSGQLAQAMLAYESILALQPDHFGALNMLGVALHQSGDSSKAIDLIQRAIEIKPGYVGALSNLGNIFSDVGRFDEAVQSYDQALAEKTDAVELYINRGLALHQLKQYQSAISSYEKAVELNPQSAETYNNWGNALKELNQPQQALAYFDKALAIQPQYVDAHVNRAAVLQTLRQFQAAVDSLTQVTALKPDHVLAWHHLGILWKQLKHLDAAVQCYQRAVEIEPGNADFHHHLGVALSERHHDEEAIRHFDLALKIQPTAADIYCSKSVALERLGRYAEIVDACSRAISLNPGMPEAYLNRGNALHALGQRDAALESYRQALACKPDFADGHNNLGDCLRELGQYESALDSFETALQLQDDYPFLLGLYLHTAMQICDWCRYEKRLPDLVQRMGNWERVTFPFPALGLLDSLTAQKTASQLWVEHKAPLSHLLPPLAKRGQGDKIKIGYYSADLHTHATAYLMAELFEQHDRNRFELIAFSFGPDQQDEMRQRLVAAFDRFIDVRGMSDIAVAKLSRELQIDIAVDLKGFTADNRAGIFSHRAAPIQVSYMGYPGTMSAEYIDYLIADATLIPESSRDGYSEKIVYMPDSYQVNDSKRRIAEKAFTRAELGLPKDGFVFCCFNNNYKITPEGFDSWMRILQAVPGSVLWLLEDNSVAACNLRREASKRGVDAGRLVFAKRMHSAEHLARHRAADLFIDTLPCNAHTTASDALWAGLPILTQAGEAFAARVAASLLHAIGLPDLIVSSQADYEALAIQLATQPDRLAEIKRRLAANLKTSPLFDTPQYTRHLERAYSQMYDRYQANMAPDHLFVAG